MRHLCLLFLALSLFACRPKGPLVLRAGLQIQQSQPLASGNFVLATQQDQEAIITISGDDIELDFSEVVLVGTEQPAQPDHFKGIGILVKNGKNIRIKNAQVRGYKIGLMVENVDSLWLENCNFSYNHRPALADSEKVESSIQNIGIWLKNCRYPTVKQVKISQGAHGIRLDSCRGGLFYNNSIQYNSGTALLLHHSIQNQILHNQLDWNTRSLTATETKNALAYGIFLSAQSHQNTIAHNSITHCDIGLMIEDQTLPSLPNQSNLIANNQYTPAVKQELVIPDSSGNILALSPDKMPVLLSDGMDTQIPASQLQGLNYILMDEWGPYNFQYPAIWLRSIEATQYTFALFGPLGNWKLVGGKGFKSVSKKTGAIPATIVFEKEPSADRLSIELEYIGSSFTTPFGTTWGKGKIYPLKWKE